MVAIKVNIYHIKVRTKNETRLRKSIYVARKTKLV